MFPSVEKQLGEMDSISSIKHGKGQSFPGIVKLLFLILFAVMLFAGFVSVLFFIGHMFPVTRPLIVPILLCTLPLYMWVHLVNSWRKKRIVFGKGSFVVYHRKSQPMGFWLSFSFLFITNLVSSVWCGVLIRWASLGHLW